jgi:O-antigen/teichoic acid export membrane protein
MSQPGQMDTRSLRDAALAGVRWVAAGRVAAEIVALGSSIVLARLLAPAEFGQAAVVLVLLTFATALMGNSFGTPLVQRKDIEHGHVRTSISLSLVSGALLSGIVFLGAPLAKPLFGEDISGLLQLMSPVFLITSFGLVPHALLQRALDFRRIASVEVTSIVARAGAQLSLAALGLGAEALILGALVGSLVFSLLLLAAAPGGWPGWNRRRAWEISGFGLPTALSGLLSQTNRNLDYIILGAMMAPAQVGHYWRGYQLGVEYERKLTTIMTRMALPVLSRASSFDEMRRIRMHIMRTNAVAIFGALGTFIVVAPDLVPLLFGAAWEPSVVPAQILAVAGMAAATNAGAGPLVLAAGRPRALMMLSLAFFFLYGATILLAAPHGLIVVCVAATAANVVRTCAMHWLLLDRMLGIPLSDLRHELAPAVTGTLAVFAVTVPVAELLRSVDVPAAAVIALIAAIAPLVYLAVLRALFRGAWQDLSTILRRVFARSRAPRAASLQAAHGGS